MKASYRVKFLDIILFNVYHWSRSPIMLVITLIGIGTISILNWQTVFKGSDEILLIVRIFTFAILETLIIAGYFIVLLLTIIFTNISKMNKTVLTDCVITLGTDIISTESKFVRAEYKWDAIQRLIRTRSYIFLYVMQHGALIVPKRAFQSNEALEKFWLECNARIKTA
jgi:hypothetical protein